MRLTEQTRYALRVIAFCAARHPDVVRVSDVAEASGLTDYTVFKLLKTARQAGLLMSTRGRGGGIQLGFNPAVMSVGLVVRAFEPRFQKCDPASRMVEDEVFNDPIDRNTNEAIGRGFNAFLRELDSIRIADLLEDDAVSQLSA